jgi:hypothetical protein
MFEWNAEKKKTSYGQTQLGVSSLILIFTVLCLVVFCTLSLASAKADSKLALKNEASVMDYYKADGKAEQLLKNINESAIVLAGESADSAQFQDLLYKKYGGAYDSANNMLSYTVEVGKEQILLVRLQLFKANEIKPDQKNYKLVSWLIKNKEDYAVDESMPVWDGE